MSKFLKVLVGLIVIAGIAFFIMKGIGEALDKESKAYADDVIVKVVTSWNMEELLNRASPELIQALNADHAVTESVVEMWKRLGSLQEYLGSQGQAGVSFSPKGKVVIAQYAADLQFENAPARIILITEKREGRWLIHKFHVDSNLFLEQ